MKTLNILFLVGVFAVHSCKQNKTVATTETKAEKTEIKQQTAPGTAKVEVVEESTEKPKSNETSVKGLVVSFYSIGGGIDLDAARKFDTWIAAYKTSNGQAIAYEKIGWGREGEVDFCIQLESVEITEAIAFVDAAKGELSACKMMHFTVNGECKRKRK